MPELTRRIICNTCCFLLMPRAPPHTTLFPYTTLFRSQEHLRLHGDDGAGEDPRRPRAGDAPHARHREARGRLPHDLLHRSEEHTSELQSHVNLVCRLLLEKKKTTYEEFHYVYQIYLY